MGLTSFSRATSRPASGKGRAALLAANGILDTHGREGESGAEGPALVGIALGGEDRALLHAGAELFGAVVKLGLVAGVTGEEGA